MDDGQPVRHRLAAALRGRDFPSKYRFPFRVREGFVALIGTLIGARVEPEMLSRVSELWISLAAVTVFVILAHTWNYQLFRRLAGYDRVTSFYAGTPGGLIDSVELGQASGANVQLLTLQQYWRVILVIVLVPTGLSLLHGEALGSVAGVKLSDDAGSDLSGMPVLLVVAAAGLTLGRVLKLPAGPLVGSMGLSAVLSATGLVHLHSPNWVMAMAQVVIGVSIGARFIGITGKMVRMSILYAMVSVGGMLLIGMAIARLTAPLVGEGFEVMFISMAPGGAMEMGLVALSLSVNPAFVTFHHLYRIGIAVLDLTVVGPRLGFGPAKSPTPGE